MTVDLSYNLPDSTTLVEKQTVPAMTWAHASQLVRRYIHANDLAGSTWSGGTVRINGKVVGRISYNGRAWDTNNNVIAR